MREFKLINANGAEFNLTSTASFFQNPDGLGFSRDIDCERAGYDFIEIKDDPKQKTPNGEIVFDGYATYQAFVAFIKATPLVLCYKPLDTWYFMDCKVSRLKKTEINKASRRLICDVDFLGYSTWYSALKSYQAASTEGDGKTYPYTYPYTYIETTAGSTKIYNTGSIDSPCILHIFGPVENPSWTLIHNGDVIYTGKVIATIAEGNKLLVNASPKDLEIAEYTTSGEYVQNRYQDSDFSTARFIFAPPGESTVTFAHEGVAGINATVEVKQLADTV